MANHDWGTFTIRAPSDLPKDIGSAETQLSNTTVVELLRFIVFPSVVFSSLVPKSTFAIMVV